jgi:hypothetical protein
MLLLHLRYRRMVWPLLSTSLMISIPDVHWNRLFPFGTSGLVSPVALHPHEPKWINTLGKYWNLGNSDQLRLYFAPLMLCFDSNRRATEECVNRVTITPKPKPNQPKFEITLMGDKMHWQFRPRSKEKKAKTIPFKAFQCPMLSSSSSERNSIRFHARRQMPPSLSVSRLSIFGHCSTGSLLDLNRSFDLGKTESQLHLDFQTLFTRVLRSLTHPSLFPSEQTLKSGIRLVPSV